MARLWPGPAEAEFLRFLLPMPGLGMRLLLSATLFASGLAFWMLGRGPVAMALGLLLLLLGHLPIWVRGLSTSPGGATPEHEEIWVPVEEGWLERVTELERRGKAWDTSPWDLTSGRGCLMLLVLGVVVVGAAIGVGLRLGADPALRFALAGAALLAPQWLNGMRTTWNPSELRLKGEALAVARAAAAEHGGEELEPVPLLALREGRRGSYPVDARLMLRPRGEDESGFLGVQVQVALNNVKGADYPYLYCVLLGKEEFRLPSSPERHRRPESRVRFVFERGSGEDVGYLVIRQHADRRGGWHTRPPQIQEIVELALRVGLAAWQENRQGVKG